MEELPNWLKSIDNGKIGEARTKALLIEKFWILERSVDIEGADFIIQRKILRDNLLDKEPPRFGYVQSKYCINEDTQIKIRNDYITDSEGNPRSEFFLLVHTGTVDNAKVFFFETNDIQKYFKSDGNHHSIRFKDISGVIQ